MGRSVPTQGSAHARRKKEMEQAAMPGPSKIRERITNLGIGSGSGMPPRDKITHCATSQLGARTDYGLTGHDDICFDV